MTSPIDAVRAVHNAFRNDITVIDAAALDAARGKPGLAATIERFRFFNEMLEWHAHGEDLLIGPLLESVAPSVYSSYAHDPVAWMFPLMNEQDRASVTLFWKTTMPAPVFAGASLLIQRAVGGT